MLAQKPIWSDFDRREEALRKKFHATKHMSEADRKWLVGQVRHGTPPHRMVCQFVIVEAVGYGAFPRPLALRTLERASIAAPPGERGLPAQNYWALAPGGLTRSFDAGWREYQGVVHGKHSASDIDSRERAFVDRNLGQGGQYAGSLLVSKSHLKPTARRWALKTVGEQVAKKPAKQRPFWEFVRRVVLARNPGK